MVEFFKFLCKSKDVSFVDQKKKRKKRERERERQNEKEKGSNKDVFELSFKKRE